MVGAISPSSRSLGEKMIENLNFDEIDLIVELGPGTGVFTDLILSKLKPSAKMLVFELNDNFHAGLTARIHDSRVALIHDSAEFIAKYLNGDNQPDVIVSSLPLMMFPDELRRNIVNESYATLKHKGKYVQFQYSLQSKKLLENVFDTVSIKFTIKNFPPAFIYTCTKK